MLRVAKGKATSINMFKRKKKSLLAMHVFMISQFHFSQIHLMT